MLVGTVMKTTEEASPAAEPSVSTAKEPEKQTSVEVMDGKLFYKGTPVSEMKAYPMDIARHSFSLVATNASSAQASFPALLTVWPIFNFRVVGIAMQ